ncbi:Heterotrimeric G-protein alpha subunit [Mycena sanguinolenta]|uniref:Heterotrimeric G-protein alpha subunit n=1 Tax=Mycena sanguinolenta TaxID=230812 RepID=A0A8H7DH82_9AGAR|nr:Heterotrimeric G-protein alpha subunit [Mycena sanguinolenta]
MGASSSRLARERSEAIDRQLKAESLQSKKEVRVLLLGSDHASRSTLIKHMKLLHGFTLEELAAFRSAIHKTLIDSAHGIVLALRTSGLDGMLAEEHRHLLDVILHVKSDDTLNPEIAGAIETLWGIPAVVRLLDNNQGEVYLPDSAVYFFTQIQRLAQPEEREKWIHCFESVTSIIFCTALTDYDQVLLEERGQNRMRQSLVLFESIINSRWLLRTSIILFFTEMDAFEAKIRKIPLARYFPEYTSGPDVIKAAKYFLWCFMQENRARLSVYSHLARTNDTKCMRPSSRPSRRRFSKTRSRTRSEHRLLSSRFTLLKTAERGLNGTFNQPPPAPEFLAPRDGFCLPYARYANSE